MAQLNLNGDPILTINSDGTMGLSEKYSHTRVATAFWEVLASIACIDVDVFHVESKKLVRSNNINRMAYKLLIVEMIGLQQSDVRREDLILDELDQLWLSFNDQERAEMDAFSRALNLLRKDV